MKTIKIDFTDFWWGFDKTNNYFWNLLSQKFNLEINSNPDFLIYGPKGVGHRRYNCIKIFYTGENVRPNFCECDFAFTFDYPVTTKNYRLPLYALYDDPLKIIGKPPVSTILMEKTKFCNFIYSNPNASKRIEFFNLLNEYKKVDAGGSVLNNMGYQVQNKRDFIRGYKFTISFENESYPGYTTEKIFEPMLENSIPVYWGNPLIHKEFNTKSFINVHEFNSLQDVVDRIIHIDQDDELFASYLSEPYFINNEVPDYLLGESILRKFEYIFEQLGIYKPVSDSWKSRIVLMRNSISSRLKRYIRKHQ